MGSTPEIDRDSISGTDYGFVNRSVKNLLIAMAIKIFTESGIEYVLYQILYFILLKSMV